MMKGGNSTATDTLEKSVRVNQKIRSPEVRVIGIDGKQMGIFPIQEALNLANDDGYDLVEVNPKAEPPVCRVMDYGKFKYQQKKRTQEARKHQTTVQIKEIKLRPKTDEHDVQFKIKHIQRFLNSGDKVKVTMVFKGREVIHSDIATELMNRIVKEIEEIGLVEKPSKLEGRNMFMIIAPKPQK
jgi:translation initiation factor IF-3